MHQSFVKILSKHLAPNKKVSFAFQQNSGTMPMMKPSPTEIVELFTFVEVTLVQYATVAGHFPGVAAATVMAKRKKANTVEVAVEEPPKDEPQACAVTPRPKSNLKGPNRSATPASPVKTDSKSPEPKKASKGGGKGKSGKSEARQEKRRQQCIPFYRGIRKKGDHCNYEHQVDSEGRPMPVGPEIPDI